MQDSVIDVAEAQQQKINDLVMGMLAEHSIKACLFRHTDPHAAQLYVDQDPQIWHIRSRTRTDLSLASGTGTLAWDTASFPDVETAFQHALDEVWQSRHAH